MPPRRSALLDLRQPEFRTFREGVTGAAEEVIGIAASAGLVLDDWQCEALSDALQERQDGKWANPQVAEVLPRQNGKNGNLEARQLGGLYVLNERLQTHTAHRFDTCLEHFRRIRGLIEGTPDLSRHVKKILDSNGKESIELMNGNRLLFKARSKGAGRGFDGDAIYFDEAYYLYDLGSMVPSLSAQPNPQLWFTSSHPVEGPESDELRRIMRRGRAGKARMAYLEYGAHIDADPKDDFDLWEAEVLSRLEDREAWAEANPALGIRLTEEYILDVELSAMKPMDFARERLGIVILGDEEDDESEIPPEDWKACLGDLIEFPPTFAIDGTLDRKWFSIGAAGQQGDQVALEVVDHRSGAGWVVDRAKELDAKHKPKAWMIDPRSAAGSFIRELTDAGLNVVEANTSEHCRAAADLYDAILAHQVLHSGQPELDSAVKGATKRVVGDAWLWDRKAGTVVSPLVAVGLARWGHLTAPEPVSVYEERGMRTL